MHSAEILAEPIRRRIVEILASGEHTAGNLEEVITSEFGVGRSAAQHHLRVLRDCGWTLVRGDWPERWHRLDRRVIPRLELEVHALRRLWDQRIGWIDGGNPMAPDPPQHPPLSKKGRRGRRYDPDYP